MAEALVKIIPEEKAEKDDVPPVPERPVFRPPGAMPDDRLFAKTCAAGCRLCGEACPHGAIIFRKNGRKRKIPPVLDIPEKACKWCDGFPCIEACPSGALAHEHVRPLGKAVIDIGLCSNSMGMMCDICYSVCPSTVRAIKITVGRLPEIDHDKCTGCGSCVYYCDMQPVAIRLEQAETA